MSDEKNPNNSADASNDEASDFDMTQKFTLTSSHDDEEETSAEINQEEASKEATQIIDISDKINITASSTAVPDEEESDFPPVMFTREEILGSEKAYDDGTYPYDVDDAPTEKKEKKYTSKKAVEFLNKIKKPALIAASILIILFASVYIACIATLQDSVIAKNVYIEDLNVGKMSYEEALATVKATYLFENQKVMLRHGSEEFEFDGLDIGLAASPEETTKKAFEYGKSGNKFLDGLKAFGLLLHRHTVVPVANIDQEKLDEKIWLFGLQVHGELIGHYVEVRDNNEATIWPGHTGFNNDVTKAREEVLAAFADERFKNISVTLETAPPSDITIEQVDSIIYQDPVDAEYVISDGVVTVTPDQTGRYINKEIVAPMLTEVHEGGEPVIIPWETAYADITADALNEKLFADVLASYSTDYSASSANRAANVARAASLLNGAVLAPGETFSFNDRVGKRTTYNGFYTAPEYVDGQTVQGIGGGTCQVSTTLYSAVLYAGLDIVSRTNHMFTVSYAPLGQDATVADDGVDFRFRNNTDYPIKISAYTDGGSIYVSIIGTKHTPEYTVKIDHSVSYTSGGTHVYSKRYIYENGECISDEELPSSYYKAH